MLILRKQESNGWSDNDPLGTICSANQNTKSSAQLLENLCTVEDNRNVRELMSSSKEAPQTFSKTIRLSSSNIWSMSGSPRISNLTYGSPPMISSQKAPNELKTSVGGSKSNVAVSSFERTKTGEDKDGDCCCLLAGGLGEWNIDTRGEMMPVECCSRSFTVHGLKSYR